MKAFYFPEYTYQTRKQLEDCRLQMLDGLFSHLFFGEEPTLEGWDGILVPTSKSGKN